MKHLSIILMVLIFGSAIYFSGCEKEECENCLFTEFSGQCDFIELIDGGDTTVLENGKTMITGYISKWQDTSANWRVTGISIWYMNWLIEADGITSEVWGNAEILVDGNRGKWEMSFHGDVTPTDIGFDVNDIVVGTGTEGEVKGLEATWRHEMNFSFTDPLTFVYYFEGYISE